MSQSDAKAAAPRVSQSPELVRFAVTVAAEAMFTVAPDGSILDANETACERLEYSYDELVGMSVADIDPHYPAEQWPEHFEELRRNRKSRFETQHRSKSGRIFDVEVSVAYFEFNGMEYCCSSIRDITQQKQSEHILRLQHEVLAKIAATSSVLSETLNELCAHVEEILPGAIASVMLVDASDGCLHFDAGPALTDELRDALEPLAPGKAAGSCGSAAYLKRPVIVEDTRCSAHWKDLQHVVEKFGLLACWSIPILDQRGEAFGTFAISHQQVLRPTDFHRQILETASHLASIALRRRSYEERLRLAHEELAYVGRRNTMDELASSLSHELNQPLTAIVNRAFVLEECSRDVPEMQPIQEHASSIREQATRAGDIIRSVRNMAKKRAPSRDRVCLNSLVMNSMVILDPEIRQAGATQTLQLDDSLPNIQVDAVQVQQVLINLVRNALDAMKCQSREHRNLCIATRRIGQHEVELRVSDTGPGLNANETESVFEAFHTTKPEGMGMGLTICRSIAEAHAGRLTAESGEEEGAVFCLSLPLESSLTK